MPASAPAIAGGSLAGTRVLLVEDEVDSREMLREFLEMFGVTVTTAASGNEALAKLAEAKPDLLLSDISMPDGDGLALVRALRARQADEGGLTPAVAVSAHPGVDEAILAGFHAFLSKPVDPVKLLDVMRNFLEHEEVPARRAAWNVHGAEDGKVILSFTGYVTAADVEQAIHALVLHLERGPVDVVADLRALGGFDPAAVSRGQRVAWPLRKNIRTLTVAGGSRLARLLTVAAATLMGIEHRLVDDLP